MSVSKWCGNVRPHESHGWETTEVHDGLLGPDMLMTDYWHCWGVDSTPGVISAVNRVDQARGALSRAEENAIDYARASHKRREHEAYGCDE